jgi:hypothetical protein
MIRITTLTTMVMTESLCTHVIFFLLVVYNSPHCSLLYKYGFALRYSVHPLCKRCHLLLSCSLVAVREVSSVVNSYVLFLFSIEFNSPL